MPIREIEPEFHERLGHIVTSWAVIETLQAEFLAHLLQADPGSMYIMTQNVSANTVTGWIRTMTPIQLSDQKVSNVLLIFLPKSTTFARTEMPLFTAFGLLNPTLARSLSKPSAGNAQTS